MPKHIQVSPDEDLSLYAGGKAEAVPARRAPQAPPPPEDPSAEATPTQVPSRAATPPPPAAAPVRPLAPVPELMPSYTDLEEARTVMAPEPRLAQEARTVAAEATQRVTTPAAPASSTAPAPTPVSVPAPLAVGSPATPAVTGVVPAAGPSPVLAALASLIIPGAGQIWAGQTLKGGALLGVGVFTCCLFGLVNLISAADAYLIAEKKQKGEPVGDWTFF